MLVSLALLYFLALLQPLFHPFDREKVGWLIGAVPLFLTFHFWGLTEEARLHPVTESYQWVPSLGISISFRLDSLALLFALVILSIGTFVVVYAGNYLKHHPELSRFYAFLLIFMASMLGLVLSDNLILVFIFWELTTIASYLLIGFNHERQGAREAAQKALVITTFAGLALLVGILLLGDITGSYELSEILLHSEEIKAHKHYPFILLLVAFGAFAKSAQVPFHFWLPGAMAAPTPVSAYLHSATMVNAGIYLLLRLTPILGGSELWTGLLVSVGLCTMTLGAILSFFPKDLKLILAYSTISVLGMMVALIGVGTKAAIAGAIFLLVGHALYKACLFLVAGSIDYAIGTRNIHSLGGLRSQMPVTAIASLLAAASCAGLPFLLGFWGKETMLIALIELPKVGLIAVGFLGVSAAFIFSASFITGVAPFFASGYKVPIKLKKVPWAMQLGPLVFGLSGLYLGLFPEDLSQSLLFPAASVVLGTEVELPLAFWHGPNPAFFLTLLVYLSGITLILLHQKTSKKFKSSKWLRALSPDQYYDLLMIGLQKTAQLNKDILQNGNLRYYLITIIFSSTSIILLELRGTELFIPVDFSNVPAFAYGFTAIIFASLFLAVQAQRFATAIVSLSMMGLGVVLFFAYFSAPDLALTQALVEALSLVLFILMLSKLPKYQRSSGKLARIRDAVISAIFGGVITAILLLADRFKSFPSISNYYKENALSLGQGRNLVNIIIVDFRSLDTLGEITVISVAAIGVFSLVGLKMTTKKEKE